MLRSLNRIPDPERWKFWLPITLGIKVVIILVLLGIGGIGGVGKLAVWWSDSPMYFEPFDSLLEGGDYTPDVRMPGYGSAYMLVRLLSTPPLCYDLLVLLQAAMAAVSMYVLARAAYRLGGSHKAFLAVLALHAVSISVQWYDSLMLTESFCTSALIFCFDRLVAWQRNRNNTALWVAGTWLTWAIFLKPVMAPVLLIVLVALWAGRINWRAYLRAALVFMLPFILIDGAWILRNALHHGGIFPLTRVLFVSEDNPTPSLRATQFVVLWGGDVVWWSDPQAHIRIFNIGLDQVPGKTNADAIVWPEGIYTTAYNEDSLRTIGREILALKEPTLSEAERAAGYTAINTRLERYATAFVAERPMEHHLYSRWRALVRFIRQTGNPIAYDLPFAAMPIHQKAIKLFHIAMHYGTLVLGLFGAIRWWRTTNWRVPATMLVLIVPFGILVFPILLRFSEHRYLVPFIPFMLLGAVLGALPQRKPLP